MDLSSPFYYFLFIHLFLFIYSFFGVDQVYPIISFLYIINRWFMINCIFYDFFQDIICFLDLIQSILTFVLLLSDILFACNIISCYMKQSIVVYVYPYIYTFWRSSLLLLFPCFYMTISSHRFGNVVKTSCILTFLKIALFCFHFWIIFKINRILGWQTFILALWRCYSIISQLT